MGVDERMKRKREMQREMGEKSMYMQRNREWWDTFVIQVNVGEKSMGERTRFQVCEWYELSEREREKGGKEKIMQLIPVWFQFVSFISYPECLREAWLVSITWAKKYRNLCWMKHLSFSLLLLLSLFACIKRSEFLIAMGSHLKHTWY